MINNCEFFRINGVIYAINGILTGEGMKCTVLKQVEDKWKKVGVEEEHKILHKIYAFEVRAR